MRTRGRAAARAISLCSTSIELAALVAGMVLGGRAGIGTLVYAAAIGPAAQWSIQLFDKDPA